MKKIFSLALVLGMFFCATVAMSAVPAGDHAPDFQGKTLEGKDFQLSDYKGEYVLLKIGTTWCPSCRDQTKAINSLYPYLEEKGVKFVDVFVDESERSVKKYFKKGKYRKPDVIILDEGPAYKAYNVYVIPRLILIDRDFKVVRDGDALSAKKLRVLLEKTLVDN